jgi:acyl carrier protein
MKPLSEEALESFEDIREILMELLDVEAEEIRLHSYLVRDLGVESIDFLELAVALNERFQIEVQDDTVFLRNLRLHLSKASESKAEPLDFLKGPYAFLAVDRLQEILADLNGGPVIQVRDLVSYVQWQMTDSQAA